MDSISTASFLDHQNWQVPERLSVAVQLTKEDDKDGALAGPIDQRKLSVVEATLLNSHQVLYHEFFFEENTPLMAHYELMNATINAIWVQMPVYKHVTFLCQTCNIVECYDVCHPIS